MDGRTVSVFVVWVAGWLIGIGRHFLYVMLLLLGRVLLPVANFAIIGGLLLFLFCLFLRPDMALPMWAGAALAFAAVAFVVLYEAALRVVAPDWVAWYPNAES